MVWLIDTERSRSFLGTFVSNPDRDGKEGRILYHRCATDTARLPGSHAFILLELKRR